MVDLLFKLNSHLILSFTFNHSLSGQLTGNRIDSARSTEFGQNSRSIVRYVGQLMKLVWSGHWGAVLYAARWPTGRYWQTDNVQNQRKSDRPPCSPRLIGLILFANETNLVKSPGYVVKAITSNLHSPGNRSRLSPSDPSDMIQAHDN